MSITPRISWAEAGYADQRYQIIKQPNGSSRVSLPRHAFLLLTIVVLCAVCTSAHADWVDLGVSWRCEKAKTFSIRPVVITSLGERLALQPGFRKIKDGFHNKPPYTTDLRCNLPGATVKASIYARGSTYQISLWVNNGVIFENELFNSGLGFEPVLYQIDVVSHGDGIDPKIVICRGNWSWEKNYDEGICKMLAYTTPK